MTSTWSLFVQILAVIVVMTIAITLIIAIFSYVGYKIRQRRKPVAVEEIPNFFWRYTPDMFIPPPARAELNAGKSAKSLEVGGETEA